MGEGRLFMSDLPSDNPVGTQEKEQSENQMKPVPFGGPNDSIPDGNFDDTDARTLALRIPWGPAWLFRSQAVPHLGRTA